MTKDVLVKLAVLSVLDKSNTVFEAMRNYMVEFESKKLLIGLACLEKGIIPAQSTFELNKYMSNLSYLDARKAKRKFRKLHRKVRKNLELDRDTVHLDLVLGKKGQVPDRFQKSSRKHLVFESIMEEMNVKRSL
jgi:hypothetical protein